ncbi:hypothetical protein A5819_000955 [Enterococcus sp. 7E2_DIV0204]|uniref:Mor transcription activator family protein n=1 Tax=unclassified Enterococcus TaxID=2608891 RepID=UPI000A32CC51|nr:MULTISPECIES: Mor transcription activator family protein [unclassified Enterococcus]OTN88474.1 hypothetical protein A5819_000955 [Enterococcus sp. 7E2_DIV0204]OTP50943.1 hypothetical protein A5884_000129 [Enterococcus sp. 7D2_DIV0200]
MGIDLDCLAVSYQSVADFLQEEKLSPDLLAKFHYMFKGQQISYPMKLYDKDRVAKKIKEMYQQNLEIDIRQLTDQYGFSTRWIQGVVNEAMKECVNL